MQISNIEIVLSGRNTIFLQWEPVGLIGSPLDYETQIHFARSESGPWEVVAKGLQNEYSFRHSIEIRDRWSPPFYRIDIVHKPSNESVSSDIVYPRHPPDMRAIGIRRRLENLLRGEYGVEIFFLKLRVEGEVDEETFDPILNRPKGKKGSAFGHKYKGGFYNPIHLWGKLGIDPILTRPLNIGSMSANQSGFWIASEPLLNPGDMIVEKYTNKRWRVGQQVQRFARRQTLFRQVCLLDEIPINDPEYEVVIEGQ